MKKKKKSVSFTTQYLIMLSAVLLVANFILGGVMMAQSVSTIQEMVRKNMLDMSNTAASLINGDIIGSLTEEDIGSPFYNYILSELTAFQENADIEYIYTVKQVDDKHFVFVIDADPEDPADFGEDVLVTDALIKAGSGTAAVDDEPAEDEWGNFYSSYSPIFDSNGKVAGIVGVDFNSEWYDRQIREHTLSIIIITSFSLFVTCIMIVFVTGSVRRKFRELNTELSALASDVDELAKDLASEPGYEKDRAERDNTEEEEDADLSGNAASPAEIETISRKIRSMHKEMKSYLDFIHRRASTDALTSIGNTTAYKEKQEQLEKEIAEGTAQFHVAVFDINDLKYLNDEFGHLCGDRMIRGAASLIADVFGEERTYRIGGDEFAVIVEGMTDAGMNVKLLDLEAEIDEYNELNRSREGSLSVSKGSASYIKGVDTSFRSVFSRADQEMYNQKSEYHRHHARERSERDESSAKDYEF